MKKQFQSKSVPRGTRTIWRYLGALFILFTFAIGNVWAQTSWVRLDSIDFTNTTDFPAQTITGAKSAVTTATINGVFFRAKAKKSIKINNTTAGVDFDGQNGDASSHHFGIPVTGVNGSIKVIIYHDYNSTSANFKMGISHATDNDPSGTQTWDLSVGNSGATKNANDWVMTKSGLTGSEYIVWAMEAGSSYKVIKKIAIYTEAPSCDATAPGNISKGALVAGELTLTAAGAPAANNVWYWQSSATGEDKTLSGASRTVTAAGTYYIRSYYNNSCWSDAKSFTVTATDLVANYTVVYKDGTTELGNEVIAVGSHPEGIADPKKDCYTFAGWMNGTTPVADVTAISGTKDEVITLTASWTPNYASTLDFAAITTAGTTGSNPIGTFLASGNMVASNLGGDSGWETSTAKSGFIGYKLKNTSAVVKFLVKAGKEVEITLGSVGAAAKLNKGGVESEIAKKSGDNEQTVIPAFVAESDMLVTITTNASDKSTVTLKKISIVDPAPKYTVTYALNGATGTTPTEVDHKAGEKFNLHDGVTGITAPTNKTFVNWKDQDDALFDGGAEYTMPAKNVTLTAQWAGDVYTVKYMDGEDLLDTKVVEVGSHPADIEHPTKPLYTFAAWQLSGSDVILDDVSGAKDAEVILTVRWAVAYASNVNFKEAATQALGVETALNTYHYASDAGDISFEEKGLKIKTNAARFYFNVAPGKVAEIKFGNISGATYSVDGGTAETLSTSQLKATYSASAQSCVMTMTTAAYNIVEKVTIHDPYQVTFDANGGDPVAPQNGTPSVTLPLPVKGTESFLGWFDGDTKVGEAGESYTPTANITLVAHWEAVSTDARLASIEFSAAGTLSPAFDPEVTSYTYTMPYGTAAIPTITGATSVNAKAQDPIIGDAAAAWGDAQTVKGVAQSGDKKTYTITMAKAPKDGVCIVKADLAAGSSAASITATSGAYKDADNIAINVAKDLKLGSTGAYVKVAVKDTYFQDGDVVEIVLRTDKSASAWLQIFADEGTTLVAEMKSGVSNATPNHLTISGVPENTSALYLYRTEAADGNMNPYPTSMAVYRAMNPVLTAITIDERAGVIDPLDDKHFNVQIPYEADLANLTIVPTIVWNAPAAENSIVVNDGGAWVEGDNTYKLTDKDGDYTVYTLTLTRDVLKHTVSFNTHGGSAVASMEIEHNTYLTSVPNDPSKEDYIFQYWSLTDGGEEVDVTTVKINEDKEFHAVWVSDGGIKLLDGSTVNHTNFITAVTATETVEFKGNTVNYAKFSGTCGSVSNVKDLTRVIAYNATTNKTKIRISAHNNSTSARNILVKGLVEGADAAVDLATIALGNKEDKVSDWIEFNNAANRTIYIMVGSSAGDVYFTQVKVIESGETPMKQAGEAGYSLNLNKGRFFGLANTDLAFEGLNARLSGDYTALNSGYAKLNATSMSFTVASDMNLVVTTNNSKTYYVTKGAAGTDNETAKTGVSEFDLTAGTWYITAGSDEVQFTNIAFEAPKCAEPVIDAQPATKEDFGAGNLTASVTAHATDGANLSYQWYNADGDVAVVGETATTATLETTTEGTYYVIITASKENYQNRTIKSDEATLGYRALNDATLSALSYGGTAITLEDGVYEYAVLLDEGTTVVPALSATATMAVYGATAVPTDAAAFVDYKATSTVLVTAEDGATTQTYTVKFTVQHEYTEIEDVTGNTSWNWAGVADVTEGDGIVVDGSHGLVLANYIAAVNFEKLEAHVGARAYRSNSYPAYQGTSLKFHTTVAGKLVINARRSSGSPLMKVNGAEIATLTSTLTEYVTFVPAGDVTITVTGNEMRIYSMEFQVLSEITPSYTRDNLNPANIGTLCWKNDGVLFGGTVYELTGKDENSKLVFDEVIGNVIKGGKPCIFVPENGNTEIKVYNTKNDDVDAGEFNGMKGTYEVLSTIADGENSPLWGNYIISNNKYIYVDYNNCRLGEYRAYIMPLENVPSADPNPSQGAPRRRLVVGGNQAPTVVTDVENLNASEQPVKLLINGQIFILRGEKMFDATGRLVK